MINVCNHCGVEFPKATKYVNQSLKLSWKHFCSSTCRQAAQTKKIELSCGTCGAPVITQQNRLRGSKSGYVFCNKSCAVKYNNRILRSGINHPNHQIAVRRRLNGEGGDDHYRTIAFAHHDKECVVCGENKIVEVHHLNGNHDDNRPENLIPLCPTHHKYWHSKWRCLIEEKVRAYQETFFERLIMETQDDCDLHFGELGEAPEVEL